jgi:predicted NBD/HSP70 family sugar kinase
MALGMSESGTSPLLKERNTNLVTVRRDDVGQRSESVRRANLSAIVRELHTDGPLSRSELVARTGLTRTAIRGLIGELVAADLATEEPAVPLGTPGRPSPLVRLNPDRAVVLALEIAVDSLAVALVGAGGDVLQLERVDLPRGHTSVDEIIGDLIDLSDMVLGRLPRRDAIVGVGVSVVGVVRRTDGLVSMAPNLGWREVPLGQRLADALRLDVRVTVANDGDLGALAEVRRGAAIGADDVLFISSEVGVGGGLIAGGKPLGGAAGYGGEIGHIPVNPIGSACRCGSVGCWETEVGEGALLRRVGRSPGGGRGAVDEVLLEAERGVGHALAALDDVGRWLGFGLAGLVNVFNPRLVVLGGLFGRYYPFVIETVERELDRRALPGPRGLVAIVPATLGIDASVLGAAELALEPLLDDPAVLVGPREAVPELIGS